MPEAFRAFHVQIEAARETFNETVASIAERHTVFLAIGPLEAAAAEPYEAQMQKLALTVWPTALRVEPLDSETPMRYLARLCETDLASECKHIVPEYWPVEIATLVWRRLQSRAKEAYLRCRACRGDDSYEKTLERYEENTTRANSDLASARKRYSPRHWPRGGEHASPWTDPPVLHLGSDGAARFLDEEVGDGRWREAIGVRRGDAQVLGLHLRPTATVRSLRSVLKDAAAAGYSEVALMVREPVFPWAALEYRIATVRQRRLRTVDSRDADTLQVLVRALDTTAKQFAAEPGGLLVQL